jgi:hypothetical protein
MDGWSQQLLSSLHGMPLKTFAVTPATRSWPHLDTWVCMLLQCCRCWQVDVHVCLQLLCTAAVGAPHCACQQHSHGYALTGGSQRGSGHHAWQVISYKLQIKDSESCEASVEGKWSEGECAHRGAPSSSNWHGALAVHARTLGVQAWVATRSGFKHATARRPSVHRSVFDPQVCHLTC